MTLLFFVPYGIELESDYQISVQLLVVNVAVLLGFGIIVMNGANHVLSNSGFSTYTPALEANAIKGVCISGMSNIGLSTLVIVVSEQAPRTSNSRVSAFVFQTNNKAVVIQFFQFIQAISITLQDDQNTLQDKQIDATMNKIIANLEKQVGAKLR